MSIFQGVPSCQFSFKKKGGSQKSVFNYSILKASNIPNKITKIVRLEVQKLPQQALKLPIKQVPSTFLRLIMILTTMTLNLLGVNLNRIRSKPDTRSERFPHFLLNCPWGRSNTTYPFIGHFQTPLPLVTKRDINEDPSPSLRNVVVRVGLLWVVLRKFILHATRKNAFFLIFRPIDVGNSVEFSQLYFEAIFRTT